MAETNDDIELILTLRFAASVCHELASDEDLDMRSALLALAGLWERVAVAASVAANVDAFGEARLASALGEWRGGTGGEELVKTLVEEIGNIAVRLYTSTAPTDLKILLEEMLEITDDLIRFDEVSVPTEENDLVPERIASDAADHADLGDRTPAEAASVLDLDVEVFPVWFATNRAPFDADDLGKGFSGRRSVDGVRHGRCYVRVPQSHRLGSLGSGPLWRIRHGDDRLRVHDIAGFDAADFWERVGAATDGSARGRHAVVFVHGYNVSFVDAARRAAQLGTDLGVRGPMACFSWPSKGRLFGYFADANSIEASASDIVDFLVSLATRPEIEAVHVIAHSMGNRGALAAVNAISVEAERLSGRRFGQFILAAADVDAQVFRASAAAYGRTGTGTTLYVSPKDKALRLSERISAFPRAGRVPPIQIVDGIDTVDAGDIDVSSLGHGYFAEADAVLKDIHDLLSTGRRPSERFGLGERRDEEGQTYWSLKA